MLLLDILLKNKVDQIIMDDRNWENLSPEEKKRELFLRQKRTLDLFLERHAISQAQYDKSLGDLREKMGMQDVE